GFALGAASAADRFRSSNVRPACRVWGMAGRSGRRNIGDDIWRRHVVRRQRRIYRFVQVFVFVAHEYSRFYFDEIRYLTTPSAVSSSRQMMSYAHRTNANPKIVTMTTIELRTSSVRVGQDTFT